MFIFLSIRSIFDCDSDSDSECRVTTEVKCEVKLLCFKGVIDPLPFCLPLYNLYRIVCVSSLEEELHKIQLSPSQDERQLGAYHTFYVLPGLPLSAYRMELRAD